MQRFFSSVTSKVLATAAALVADENDDELAPAAVSQAEVEFAEVYGGLHWAAASGVGNFERLGSESPPLQPWPPVALL
jgi:hypothetical protein